MVDPINVTQETPIPQRRTSRFGRWRRWLVLGMMAVATIVGFLPTIVGARWIYQPLIDQLAAKNFRLTIDRVHLRWLSPLRLEGVVLSENSGPALLTIAQIKTDRGLLGYLMGGRRLGRIEILEPTASVELLKDGTNLDRIVRAVTEASATDTKHQRVPPAIDIDVLVHGASAKVMQHAGGLPLVVIPPFDLQASYLAAPRNGVPTNAHLIVQPTQVLDQVEITKELVDIGLGHAIPLLAQSAWFDGRVSLAVGQVDVPLDHPQHASASMQLTLHQVRSGPNEPAITRMLELIARLRQREPVHEIVFIDGSVIDVALAQERVTHSGLKFGLPKMDSRFQIATSGSVGVVDKSLELMIDIPVPIEQVARREQVQALGVPTMRLPVAGTLDKPQLDWNAMRGDAASLLGDIRGALGSDAPVAANVVSAIEGLAEGKADEAIGAAVDLVKQLRERRRERLQNQDPPTNSEGGNDAAPDSSPATPPSSSPSSSPTQRPVRDAIRDLLRRRD